MLNRLHVLILAGLSALPLEASAWAHFGGGGFVRGPDGGTAVWHRGGWAGGGWGYHGTTVVHTDWGYHGGCWGCVDATGAAVAAGAVGLAAGAAIGAAAASTPSTTLVVQQPVVITGPAIGSTVLSLPGGCTGATVNGIHYYQCGGSYYKPVFDSSGVEYRVVPNPF